MILLFIAHKSGNTSILATLNESSNNDNNDNNDDFGKNSKSGSEIVDIEIPVIVK